MAGGRTVTAVVDANVVVAQVLPLPYSGSAADKMLSWQSEGVALAAPALLAYEVATALRKAVVASMLSTAEAVDALASIQAIPIELVAPYASLHQNALIWAERLGHGAAYDAQYLALAERMRAELWTADRRLATGAQQAGAAWVRWIGEG